MKKVYVKPEIEVIEIEFESSMMADSVTSTLPDTGFGGEGDADPNEANRHRGEWGNLWAED